MARTAHRGASAGSALTRVVPQGSLGFVLLIPVPVV